MFSFWILYDLNVRNIKKGKYWQYSFYYSAVKKFLVFPGGLLVKNPPANAGDAGLIPKWGGLPGEGNGYLLQFSFFFCTVHLKGFLISPCYSVELCIQMVISFPFSFTFSFSFFSQLFVRPPQTTILFCFVSFLGGWLGYSVVNPLP